MTGLFVSVLTRPGGAHRNNRIVFQIFDKITSSLFRAFPSSFHYLVGLINPWPTALKNTQWSHRWSCSAVFGRLSILACQVQVVQRSLVRIDEAWLKQHVPVATFGRLVGVYLREATSPDLIRVTTKWPSLDWETAMAGVPLCWRIRNLSHQLRKTCLTMMVIFAATLLILILIVLVQFIGDFLRRKLATARSVSNE